MIKPPLVSILIPAYNSAMWIEETINSALAQTWPNKEIIIVDDGSMDDTLAIARGFEKEGVKVFSQENAGAGAARNKAFQESKGDYIQYLDADDLLAPDKIALQLNCLLASHQKFHVSSSAWGMFFEDSRNSIFKPSKLWHDYDDPVKWLVTAWNKSVFMIIHAWLTPRFIIEKAGTWNEELSLHDDGEFFSRVVLASSGVIFCKDALSYYRKGLSNSLSQQRTLKAENSRLRVYELYESHLLGIKNTPETRGACADNYQKFIYRVYPRFSFLLEKAEAHLNRLGGSKLKLKKSKFFNLLVTIFGWKRAIVLENILLKKEMMPHQIKEKFLRKQQF